MLKEETLKCRKFVQNVSVWPLCTANTRFSCWAAAFVHGTSHPSTGMLFVPFPGESLAFWIPNPISLSCCLLLYFSKNIFVVFTFIENCFLGQCLLVCTFEPLILVLFEKWKKVSLLHTEGRRASALWEGSQRSCSGVFDNYQGQVFYCLSCAG